MQTQIKEEPNQEVVPIGRENDFQLVDNHLFDVSIRYEGTVVGMGRLVGDGAMYWYLQDIIVQPEY